MRVSESPVRTGFRRIHLLIILAVFVIGAIIIGISMETHPHIQSHVLVLNTRQPMNVLVSVQGTPLDPGFLGLIAVIKPNTRVLNVVPISGLTMVKVNNTQEPLYQAVSSAPPAQVAKLVTRATGIPIDHYFGLNANDLTLILDALYYHSPNWPKARTPLTMLATLGYPSERIVPSEEMKLIATMVNQLPLINPIAASSLLGITKTSVTNLTSHQLFLLANYVRGDPLHQSSVTQYHHRRRAHG